MQNALTVSDSPYSVFQVLGAHGIFFPWESISYQKDFENAESVGGFFDLSFWDVIFIDGPDAADFLHRMTTVSFKNFPKEEVRHGAFLTGKAGVVTLGVFVPWKTGYLYVLPPSFGQIALTHIEKFHFAENLQATDVSAEWALLGFWNRLSAYEMGRGWENAKNLAWPDEMRPNLQWLLMPRSSAKSLIGVFFEKKTPLLGQRLYEFFRLRAGVPQVGKEMGEANIVLEGNFDRAVARSKGCYPGQEVVERIFTYGQVNRKLFPVRAEKGNSLALSDLPIPLSVDKQAVGSLVSFAEDPIDSAQGVGLAYIHKNFWNWAGDFENPAHCRIRRADPV